MAVFLLRLKCAESWLEKAIRREMGSRSDRRARGYVTMMGAEEQSANSEQV